MKILVDAQLPPGLTLLLTQAGHEACHVVEIGLRDPMMRNSGGMPSAREW